MAETTFTTEECRQLAEARVAEALFTLAADVSNEVYGLDPDTISMGMRQQAKTYKDASLTSDADLASRS